MKEAPNRSLQRYLYLCSRNLCLLSDIRVGLSGIRILGRFANANANILKNSSNNSKTLYYIVELFISYLLIQLFKGLVIYFLSYSLRREEKN